MSFTAVRAVASLDQTLRGSERLVMLALAIHANDELECWPSVPTIAREAGISERQTYRAIAGLEGRGLIDRKSGGGRRKANTYRLGIEDAARALAGPFTGVLGKNPVTHVTRIPN